MKDKIIDKIKKLLRLSKSSEPHEATLALQRALELMQEHNITDQDIAISEVKEAKSQPTGGIRVNQIMHNLATVIAKLFRCDLYYSGYYGNIHNNRSKSIANFVGTETNAEIAAYAFDVCWRKLTRARNEYLKTIPKQTKRYNKARRAHAFCIGWVHAIRQKVAALVPQEELAPAVVAYMASKDLVESNPRKVNTGNKQTSNKAALQGFMAGNAEQIHAGVTRQDTFKLN